MENKIINIGEHVESMVRWMTANLAGLFNFIKNTGNDSIAALEYYFITTPFYIIIAIFVALAWFNVSRLFSIFTALGLLLIYFMGFWEPTMETLSLVAVSTVIALLFAIPTGILVAKSNTAEKIIRPILDLMQTMPAFVYLIPAVLFFSIGKLPGAFATIIFAMPPAVRFTALGIKQVPKELEESARAFGCTPWQMLCKVELPVAKNTIFAGINQTIMMALSMVVVAGMIAAGGLGECVLEGINNLDIGLGFESGLAVVILAIILDRITQALGKKTKKKTPTQTKVQQAILSILLLASALFTFGTLFAERKEDNKHIKIAYVDGWDEGVAMTKLMKELLEEKGYKIKIDKAAIDLVLASMANGDTDVFLDVWLPITHGTKVAKLEDKLEKIGDNYHSAKLGLIVPEYVSINTIDELASNADKFNNRIIGVEKGSGISGITDRALVDYNLDMTQLNSSTVAMLAELKKAIDNKEYIVVTGWQPHWKFARWNLKFLEDPKGLYGSTEYISTYARKGFAEDKPKVAEILRKFELSEMQMASLQLALKDGNDDTEAIKQWIKQNQSVVDSWF